MSSVRSQSSRARIQNITEAQCEQFRNNPRINPLTNRVIEEDGRTARELRRRCDELFPAAAAPGAPGALGAPAPSAPIDASVPMSRLQRMRNITREQCEELRNFPNINPVTLAPIDWEGLTFQRLQRYCQRFHNIDVPSAPADPWPFRPATVSVRAQAFTAPSQTLIPMRRPAMTQEDVESLRGNVSPGTLRTIESVVEEWEKKGRYSRTEKRRYSSSPLDSPDEATLTGQCIQMLAGINAPVFRTFANRLRTICSNLTKDCETLDDIRPQLRSSFHGKAIQLQSVVPGKEFPHMYNVLRQNEEMLNSVFLGDFLENYRITYQGQEGMGLGVTRTFIQSIMKNIKEDGFFVPAEEGSARQVLTPEDILPRLQRLGYNVRTEEDILELYELIGRYFAFCVRHDLPVDLYPSRAILARMIYKDSEIHPDEYVMYYLLDMAQTATSTINLMRDADAIEHIGLSMNDEFTLVPEAQNEELTKENFKKYLRLKARHQLTRQLAKGKMQTWARLDALARGFYIRNKLRARNATVRQLDRLMCGMELTEENIRAWLAPRPDNTARIITHAHPSNKNAMRIFGWFLDILRDFGRNFPVEELGMDPRTTPLEERKRLFLEFFGKLLYFWTGLKKLDTQRTYQVLFIDNPLPRASTCFYQLKLPHGVSNRDELYKRLVNAVYNVEAGVGLLGGKKKGGHGGGKRRIYKRKLAVLARF